MKESNITDNEFNKTIGLGNATTEFDENQIFEKDVKDKFSFY